ncbi:MAG: c-type cytochrome [Verrucomicrobiae bacterium]|nr:c-type cytochrome [Verrucomicrobiae bacterium]NNJ43228.1 c-type cytochrome [Akkermansiaceae bacterium]
MSQDPNTTTPKPSVKDGPVLRDHVFDGIQEFDQKLPNWWLFTFYIAIVFFVGYWVVYYSTDSMQTPTQNIDAKMAAIEGKKKQELVAMMDKLDDTVLLEWSTNQSITDEGKAVYEQYCIACHSPGLNGGVIGRSLIDEHWEYGGKPMDLFHLVLNGSPSDAKGFNGQKMQAWKDVLGPEKSAKVVAYVASKAPHVDKTK